MDIFKKTRAMFHLPEGMTYLDGNSLGPLPYAAQDRVDAMMRDQWGEMLITGWNKAGWMEQPSRVGDRLGKLIGAETGHVVLGDTLSIKVYQALASALELKPDRKVILSDSGNFPSDLYMAEGLIRMLDRGLELRVVAPEDVEASLGDDIAVMMLTQVDYRSGRMHDMNRLTELAHKAGAIAVWDLAHSAGAVPVDLAAANVDFAVGCTYKYLNSGPGGPAFIYVAPRHAEVVNPALSGWLGHASPFAFDLNYKPGAGIERMRVGTPPVIQIAALEAALDIWEMVDMADVRARAVELSELFINEVETRCPELTLASPRDAAQRGSQVSFAHEEGYAIMQALIAHGVIGDFRAPDILRFGITPLYVGEDDILRAATTLQEIMEGQLWDRDAYRIRSRVT
ncbi:Kynureninase [Litoreibacter ascidiaceicola]|uniref:Kynureninase n=1 Tax=Litoreibacter ascidiaceicola TaxID=1486859 RepID=A0A1M4TTM2_9RHOB|nr:kynureninase [Litoreibacter ascidiaceicola]SHE47840.1 Kynureninase [Litoreibacter ascidiaceicola]